MGALTTLVFARFCPDPWSAARARSCWCREALYDGGTRGEGSNYVGYLYELHTFRPQLDGPQREPEVADVRHEAQDLVGDATPVQRANALLVQILQQHVVPEIERVCSIDNVCFNGL